MANTVKRQNYKLTPREAAIFAHLLPKEDVAFAFWRMVAAARDLDYKSIIGNPYARDTFTALPLNHGMAWCHPHDLKCKNPPMQFAWSA